MYALFADAANRPSNAAIERQRNMAKTFEAMTRYLDLVDGDKHYCTELMDAYQSILIDKLGADGCYGVAVRAPEETMHLGAPGAVGIGVKIEDGSIEILCFVATEILEQLDIGTPEIQRKLSHFHHLEWLNTMNIVTGKVTLAFQVRPGPWKSEVIESRSRELGSA